MPVVGVIAHLRHASPVRTLPARAFGTAATPALCSASAGVASTLGGAMMLMRSISLLLLASTASAQAEITMICQGTRAPFFYPAKPEPVTESMIIDMQSESVTVLGSIAAFDPIFPSCISARVIGTARCSSGTPPRAHSAFCRPSARAMEVIRGRERDCRQEKAAATISRIYMVYVQPVADSSAKAGRDGHPNARPGEDSWSLRQLW
jgi:hypothetical protein